MSSKCKQCKTVITDPVTTCPLCQNVLDTAEEEGRFTYPDISVIVKKITLLKRTFLFLGILTVVLCMFIDGKTSGRLDWSVLILVAVVYGLSILFAFLDSESGYRKRIFLILFGGTFLILMVDLLTGNLGGLSWSVNFVLPGVIFLMNIVLLLLMVINRRNWQSYMLYQIGVIFIGMIPLLLIHVGVVTYPLISELAFLSSVFVFIGTVIFGGRVARIELQRRFHI